MNEDAPHSRRLREHRRKDGPGTWFVTKNLEPRRPALTGEWARVIAEAFRFYVEHEHSVLGAFCVMPDHWHALFAPLAPPSLPGFMSKLDRWVSRATAEPVARHGCVWQDGYHDTRIRSSKQFSFVIAYIEENPVRAALAETASAWSWSSASASYAAVVCRPWPWRFEKD